MRQLVSTVEIFSLSSFQLQKCKIFSTLKILKIIKMMTNTMLLYVAQCYDRYLLTFRMKILLPYSK
jgi:hypothetical protein